MAKCLACGEEFISIGNQICFECHDDGTEETVFLEEPDVDFMQEQNDFAHDDDYISWGEEYEYGGECG